MKRKIEKKNKEKEMKIRKSFYKLHNKSIQNVSNPISLVTWKAANNEK